MNGINYEFTDAGRSVPGERNDCTVRALSEALCMPYKTVYDELTRLGRKPGRGFRFLNLISAYAPNPMDIEFLGNNLSMACSGKCSLQRFVREHQDGHYVIRIRHHVLALVDGVVRDTFLSPLGSHIKQAWRVNASTTRS